MYDGYERWNIKGAVDHKISDKISAGFSTNMATASKESGSNYSILEGFRMTPNMPCYYWEGEKAGQLISQPVKMPPSIPMVVVRLPPSIQWWTV